MNYTLKIFCQSINQCITPDELIDFIKEGHFFNRQAKFEVKQNSEEYYRLDIYYEPGKDPVIISANTNDANEIKEINEIQFVLSKSRQSGAKENIAEIMNNTKLTYSVILNQNQITDDCWEMIDAAEAYLMKKCNGILFTPENEFFDSKLKRIYKL